MRAMFDRYKYKRKLINKLDIAIKNVENSLELDAISIRRNDTMFVNAKKNKKSKLEIYAFKKEIKNLIAKRGKMSIIRLSFIELKTKLKNSKTYDEMNEVDSLVDEKIKEFEELD